MLVGMFGLAHRLSQLQRCDTRYCVVNPYLQARDNKVSWLGSDHRTGELSLYVRPGGMLHVQASPILVSAIGGPLLFLGFRIQN